MFFFKAPTLSNTLHGKHHLTEDGWSYFQQMFYLVKKEFLHQHVTISLFIIQLNREPKF